MLTAILFICLTAPGLGLIVYVVVQGLRGKADEPKTPKRRDGK